MSRSNKIKNSNSDWRFNQNITSIYSARSTKGTYLHRSTYLTDIRVGREVLVHNGRTWSSIRVNNEMIGFRAGEFVATTSWYNPRTNKSGKVELQQKVKSTKKQK